MEWRARAASGEEMPWDYEGPSIPEVEDGVFEAFHMPWEAWIREASQEYDVMNLSVWDLNQICHNLRKKSTEDTSSFRQASRYDMLLFNIRANIVKALKLVYGEVKIRHPVLGEVNPATVSVLYDLLKRDEIDLFTPLLDIKMKYREMLGAYLKPDNLKKLTLECMRKNLSKDGKVTVEGNVPSYTEKDLANTIGEVVVKNQEVLMKNLQKGLCDAITNGNISAMEIAKTMTNISVHSNLARLNTEYSNIDVNDYVCYANESIAPKRYEVYDSFDRLEFWIINENGERIPEEKIKMLRIEMVLEAVERK
jgi:hypothetical protein